MGEHDDQRRHPLLLVVDDDPTIRMIVRETMERSVFVVAEAKNGAEALLSSNRASECHPIGRSNRGSAVNSALLKEIPDSMVLLNKDG